MTDSQIVAALRKFLASENKPKDISPVDILQITRLLVQGADERDLTLGQDTLASQLCCSPDSIHRSQARLSHHEWLIVRKGGYRGRANRYAVDLEKLPLADLHRTVVSDEARKIAAQLGPILKVTSKKRLQRGWLQQWAFTIQKMLDRADGSQRVVDTINFALKHPKYRKTLERGPATLLRFWSQLTADCEKAGTQ